MSDINTLLGVMTRPLAATNDANELARERIELLTKEAASNRSENQEMRVTLQAQQKALEAQNAAIAAVQATGDVFGKGSRPGAPSRARGI